MSYVKAAMIECDCGSRYFPGFPHVCPEPELQGPYVQCGGCGTFYTDSQPRFCCGAWCVTAEPGPDDLHMVTP